ncbi:hypothetical protein OUZ56_002800 [Daphnia magna]|uniref:Uncharacterized protein n=1 Tax=Daphnia magna TaxID=35525 RepID=A0ABR0A6U0_9CRUS|nr:hypothetical protein OUZ56_002800 [Daphnia magna]
MFLKYSFIYLIIIYLLDHLVALIRHYNEVGIPPTDLNFVTYGNTPVGAQIQFNSTWRTAAAILNDIGNDRLMNLCYSILGYR